MLIDWFTVVAQIVNFLVLLALLKWLLFDRIVRAMDQREEKIATRLEEAENKRAEAAQRLEELQEKHRRLDAEREQTVQEAKDEARQQRREMVRQAREEVDKLREDWGRDLRRQQEQLVRDLSERAGEALQRAMGQAMTDLADQDLEQGIVRSFLRRLDQIDGQQRQKLAEAVQNAESKVVVASADELPDELRQEIVQGLKHRLADHVEIVFQTSPELISGLEVQSQGRALSWNLRRYVDRFGETLDQALRDEAHAEPSSEEESSEEE
jgi:F-type H+-transporting ATPase subunit b